MSETLWILFSISPRRCSTIILLAVFLVAFAGVMALSQRKRGAGEDGTVEARSLNERFEMHEEAVRAAIEDPLESKFAAST